MVNKYQVGGAVVGFLFPLPGAIVGLLMSKGKLGAKKQKGKDFGKGMAVGGVSGVAFVLVVAPMMPYKLVTPLA